MFTLEINYFPVLLSVRALITKQPKRNKRKVVSGSRVTLTEKFACKPGLSFNPLARVTLAVGLPYLLVNRALVRSALQTSNQPGTFKCARARCKACPFVCNVEKLSGPKRTIKINDHFTCTSTNVIYGITCTLCKKLYIGETGRRLGDRFREHLRDVEKDDKNASKPVARHFNLPSHSK